MQKLKAHFCASAQVTRFWLVGTIFDDGSRWDAYHDECASHLLLYVSSHSTAFISRAVRRQYVILGRIWKVHIFESFVCILGAVPLERRHAVASTHFGGGTAFDYHSNRSEFLLLGNEQEAGDLAARSAASAACHKTLINDRLSLCRYPRIKAFNAG